MKRRQIRRGGRFVHKKTKRVAVVTFIWYPLSIEYKYARPTRLHRYMTTIPYTRRTRSSYLRFLLNFEHEDHA